MGRPINRGKIRLARGSFISLSGDHHGNGGVCDAEEVSDPDLVGCHSTQRKTNSPDDEFSSCKINQSRASPWEITHLLSMQGDEGVDSLKGQSPWNKNDSHLMVTQAWRQ